MKRILILFIMLVAVAAAAFADIRVYPDEVKSGNSNIVVTVFNHEDYKATVYVDDSIARSTLKSDNSKIYVDADISGKGYYPVRVTLYNDGKLERKHTWIFVS